MMAWGQLNKNKALGRVPKGEPSIVLDGQGFRKTQYKHQLGKWNVDKRSWRRNLGPIRARA